MPSYLMKPPQNPFELSRNEASRLGYPRNVRKLDIPVPQFHCRNSPLPRNISNDFFDDLVCSTKPVHTIMRNYDRSRVNSLKSDIIAYFSYLQDRLRQQDLDYDDIVECDRVNYVSYGPRFWNWLTEKKLFNYDTLRSYSVLLYVYLCKFPWRILKLHEKLRNANLGLAKFQPRKGHFDYKMVSFKLLDLWPLHNSLKGIRSLSERQNEFNNSVSPCNRPWKNFLIQELKKCFKYYEIDFALLEMGVLYNGASLFDQFNFALTFKDDYVNIPDWSTLNLALKAIRKHFYRNYTIKVNEHVNNEGFFICFDFGHLSRGYESFECFIHLNTRDASNWKLIRFLSKCDNRFMEMTLILNYWATFLGFYDQHFSCLSFVLMIVFALQQTSRPVFNSLDQLITYSCDEYDYGTEFPLEKEFDEEVDWIRTSENKKTTGELIIEFFRYYHQFEFEDYIICPYGGEIKNKFGYYDDEDNIFISWISVEDPFDQEIDESMICKKKSMNQFRNCLSTYLTDLKLSSTNYLQVLTNPDYFDLKSNIYKRESRLNDVPFVALNSPTVSTSRTDFEINSKSTSIESNQVEIKVVDSPVHVKEAQLIDLSPLPITSDSKAEFSESTMLIDFTKINQMNNSTETQVKSSSPISVSIEKVYESEEEKCDEDDNEDQCRVM